MASTLARRRKIAADPHPELVDAVAVSRFWALVDRRGDSECWPWLGDTRDGYGLFFWHGYRRGAHELALSFTFGEQRGQGLETCHSCSNPICVNPLHLRFDTRQSNVDDMIRAGRQAWRAMSDDQIRQIRKRLQAGARGRDLAKQYGISEGMVSMIRTGKRYGDVR